MKRLPLYLLAGVLTISMHSVVVAEEKSTPTDQTDNNYYWQGTQLYNLGRLGEAFDSFEKAIQKKQNSNEAEAYLLQIRQEIVTYLSKGYIKVVVQAKYLFDENTAALKAGAMDVINRLSDILTTNDGSHVE